MQDLSFCSRYSALQTTTKIEEILKILFLFPLSHVSYCLEAPLACSSPTRFCLFQYIPIPPQLRSSIARVSSYLVFSFYHNWRFYHRSQHLKFACDLFHFTNSLRDILSVSSYTSTKHSLPLTTTCPKFAFHKFQVSQDYYKQRRPSQWPSLTWLTCPTHARGFSPHSECGWSRILSPNWNA